VQKAASSASVATEAIFAWLPPPKILLVGVATPDCAFWHRLGHPKPGYAACRRRLRGNAA